MGLVLVILGIVGLGLSGVPCLLGSRDSNRGQWASFLLNLAASLLGLAGLAAQFLGNEEISFSLPWSLPGGSLAVGLDGLSGLFLAPVFLISALGSLYGLGYWKQSENPESGRALRFFYGLLAGGMGLLLVSRNGVLFLFGWEIMALAAYFLVALEHRDANARKAAWVYWVATHLGAAALMVMFILLRNLTGTFDGPFASLDQASGSMGNALFLLALLGFGLKAGVMPFHFWLPRAHSSAPSHVSGMMSGVMLNMGIYGLVRVAGGFSHPPLWWGILVLAMGAWSGVGGILLAVGEGDLKRMLAYSSIENIGIIFMGLGLALVGRSTDNPTWTALGLSAALFHVLNHSLFKSLLFFGSGSVLHAAHTRRLDRMGGLIGVLPVTAVFFALGSCAACALPPLNGFAGEWILYRGLLDFSNHGSFTQSLVAAAAVGGLALIGSLGVLGFVRVFGMVFLGMNRSPEVVHAASGGGRSMKTAMGLLAASCLALAFFPQWVLPALERARLPWMSGFALPAAGPENVLPIPWIGRFNFLLVLAAGAFWAWMRTWGRKAWFPAGPSPETWGCGFAGAPSPRVQYTASSFSETVVRNYQGVFPLRFRRMSLRGFFPSPARFGVFESDWVLGGILLPATRRMEKRFARVRGMQQGNTSIYILYILVVFLLALLWGIGSPP